MSRYKRIFIVVLACLGLQLTYAATCPDITKAVAIGKDLVRTFKHSICIKGIEARQVLWIEKQVLPQIMNKDFLGVEPPPNWQDVISQLIQDCYPGGNLCLKETQEKSAQCVINSMPILMLTFAPWFVDNCEMLDKTVIKHWDTKKNKVKNLIREFMAQQQQQ